MPAGRDEQPPHAERKMSSERAFGPLTIPFFATYDARVSVAIVIRSF
jgi:hypothetical protein